MQKILASAGLASRREAEAWIREGRVRVDGVVARLGDRADPRLDRITLDGRRVAAAASALAQRSYWAVHKPRGVLSAARDARGQRTVVDLLPPGLPRLFPVGRLDLETEGLVLLTDDGDLAHALLHPSLGNEREYRVTARGLMTRASLEQLARGVELEDGRTAPARVGRAHLDRRAGTTRFSLTLHEGRKRQIRRALAALGHPVLRLVRIRFGPLRLGALPPAAARALHDGEVASLRRHAARLRARAEARRAEARGTGRGGGQGVEAAREVSRPARKGSRRSRRDA